VGHAQPVCGLNTRLVKKHGVYESTRLSQLAGWAVASGVRCWRQSKDVVDYHVAVQPVLQNVVSQEFFEQPRYVVHIVYNVHVATQHREAS
jgi:hypothetical protein